MRSETAASMELQVRRGWSRFSQGAQEDGRLGIKVLCHTVADVLMLWGNGSDGSHGFGRNLETDDG